MARDVVKMEVDEDIVILFVPPTKEKHDEFIDAIIDDTGMLASTSPEYKRRCIKEN